METNKLNKETLLSMRNFIKDIVVGGAIMGLVMLALSMPEVNDGGVFGTIFYYVTIIVVPIIVGRRRGKKLAADAQFNQSKALTYSGLMIGAGFLFNVIFGALKFQLYGYTLLYYIYPDLLPLFDIKHGQSTFFPVLIIAIVSIVICAPIAAFLIKKKK